MKNLLFFLLGVIVTLSVAATTTDLITFKPAKPKEIITESFYMPSEAAKWIKEKSNQGYQLGFISSQQNFSIVVMQKY